jgi:glyoxylase-like metal-dependent hydrolase (beta-lactamase superfamily II)
MMLAMKVHSINCGTFAPPLSPQIVCHVFLCETPHGIVLVDTGLGTHDYADPARRMGPARKLLRPTSGVVDTALRHVQERGLSADDVTHVVLTHMDFDHMGGLSDFPGATVHVSGAEHAAAVTSPDLLDRGRYRAAQWAHLPKFKIHHGAGDTWQHDLTGHEVLPGITLIPMPGHSRGHAAVAVQDDERGLLVHAGDAAFDSSVFADATPGGKELTKQGMLRVFEKTVGRDRAAIKRNHAALRRLNDDPAITVVTAHDKRVYDEMAAVTMA